MRKKGFIRFFAGLMAVSMLFNTSGTVTFAKEIPIKNYGLSTMDMTAPKGDLAVTLRLNYPVKNTKEGGGGIFVNLTKHEETPPKEVSSIPINLISNKGIQQINLNGVDYNAVISLLDEDGLPAKENAYISVCRITFEQIPQGRYTVSLTGDGFKDYTSKPIKLDQYSMHLSIANDNETFTIGDINKDGIVNSDDIKSIEQQIGEPSVNGMLDLNKDGIMDITDISYAFNNMWAKGNENLENTKLIASAAVNLSEIDDQLKKYEVEAGAAAKLFSEEGTGKALELKTNHVISETNPVEIQASFIGSGGSGIDMQYVNLVVPDSDGAVKSGEIIYTDEDDKVHTQPFGSGIPLKTKETGQKAGFYRLASDGQSKVITIDLGKKVAIKKITIKVTGTEGDTNLASISKVEFLQNVIPTDQTEKNTVKKLTAKGLEEEVELSWQQVSNVTGYKVRYGTKSGEYDKSVIVNDNKAKIEKLTNDTIYYFVVSAINGDWIGPESVEVQATPKVAKTPGTVGGVRISPLDGMLDVTWGSDKDAESYNLYYKMEGSSGGYTKIAGIKGASYRLTGLKNKQRYLIRVSGTNYKGEGGKSPEVVGTPEAIIVGEPEGIPTYNRIDNSHISKITLTHPDHYDSSIYKNGFDPKWMIDGNYNTHWTARSWWEEAGFVVTFDKAYEMDHMVWVTRLDDPKYKKTLNRYGVEIWTENQDLNKPGTVVVKSGSAITSTDLSSKGVEVLTFPKSYVKKIRVFTKMRDGGPALPSGTEIMFYKYYSLVDEINGLFKDDLHTELKEGVTQDTINRLSARINGTTGEFYVDKNVLNKELELAKSLLTDKPLQNIITVEQGRDAVKDHGGETSRGFSYTLNDLQPIGITAKPKDILLLYVDAKGESKLPSLVVSQYFAEYSSWQQEIPLKQGRNAIVVPTLGQGATPRGGSLYVQYHGESKDVKINVIGGNDIPMLSLPEFTLDNPSEASTKEAASKYIDELTKYVATELKGKKNIETVVENSTEIGTKGMLLSLPATKTLAALGSDKNKQVDNLYNTLLAMEEDMSIHYKVSGLSKDAVEVRNQLPTSRINIRYMQLTGRAFMYAAGAHVGIGYGSTGGMLTGKPSSVAPGGLFGWGINHEIGHVMDIAGLVEGETTNNIHSLFAQTYDGKNNTGTSRLESSEIYQKVFDKVSVSALGKSNNVFVQLAMYWQLHLAYDEGVENGVDKSFDFFSKMYQLKREGKVQASSQDMLLVKLASDTAERDLRDFFIHWGYEIDEDTKKYLDEKAYKAENKAIYYLDDDARRYRVEGKNTPMNVTTASAVAIQEGNTKKVKIDINLNHDVDEGAILGYEIYRNGKPIAFTKSKTFVDNIPTINNVSIQYKVVIYDKLLNAHTIEDAGQLRINHDGTIDNSSWTYKPINNETLLIDMKEERDISGIKITSGAGVDASTLSVTASMKADMSDSISLATDSISSGNNLVYFKKPEALPGDTRIWTYTARYLTIKVTNVDTMTDAALKKAVNIISYPGDNIEIDQGAIGKMAEDFRYGEGPDDIIKKDTIIITGSYRGDPIYNAIKLWAIYSQIDCAKEEQTISKETLIGGEQIFFAEVPQDDVYTTISDGFWIYVPEQGQDYVLPDTLKAELYRVDDPNTNANERKVSDTGYITAPTKDSLPSISFKGENYQKTGGIIR